VFNHEDLVYLSVTKRRSRREREIGGLEDIIILKNLASQRRTTGKEERKQKQK
jgi:hypothetical protein